MQATDEKPFGTTFIRLSFENHVHDHHRKAYSYAYRLCGNRDDAEDLAQEAFVRAYRAIETYDPSRPFERWLFRIISNLFVDTLRSRPKQSPLSLDSPIEGRNGNALVSDIADEEADPCRVVLSGIMDEHLQYAIDRLPPAFRMTVILTDIQGMSYDDASKVLDCAVGTIRSRLHRARALMRESLGCTRSRSRSMHTRAPTTYV